MKMIGLLSFFDEPPALLAACLKGMAESGVTHVVAVDGRYELFESDMDTSHPNQIAAIVLAARELRLGLSLEIPPGPWAGNEVQKRSALFAAGWAVADPQDWFVVVDADEIMSANVPELGAALGMMMRDGVRVGEVEVFDTLAAQAGRADWPASFTMRRLFRADMISVETNHITYVGSDGAALQGWDGLVDPVPAEDVSALVRLTHVPNERPSARLLAKQNYYAVRDESGSERGTCECGRPSVRLVAFKWRASPLGVPVSPWVEACAVCAPAWEREGRRRLLQLGLDPDTAGARPENRNGKIPTGVDR